MFDLILDSVEDFHTVEERRLHRIFCGLFDWETKKHEIKSRQEFWIPKIERTIERDKEVTQALEEQGWLVMRFWGKEIKKNCAACADKVVEALKER